MVKEMKLKCQVEKGAGRFFTCYCQLADGTPFVINAYRHQVQLNEDLTEDVSRVDGWVLVQEESRQHDRAYITLPHPSLEHGHHITVDALQLLPAHVTIDDFIRK